jgi:hypothetical protein
VRYLQPGGDQQTLLELLGQQKSVLIKRSVEENDQTINTDRTAAPPEVIDNESIGGEGY